MFHKQQPVEEDDAQQKGKCGYCGILLVRSTAEVLVHDGQMNLKGMFCSYTCRIAYVREGEAKR